MSQLDIFSSSPVKVSSVIGTDVINAKGEKLGDIKEIVIDPQTGKVVYAVVTFGGFMTLGEKLFAIPFSAFAYNVSKNEYILDIPKERLQEVNGRREVESPSTQILRQRPLLGLMRSG
jgi:sporulation protein YlmC with PRC-barrel domain